MRPHLFLWLFIFLLVACNRPQPTPTIPAVITPAGNLATTESYFPLASNDAVTATTTVTATPAPATPTASITPSPTPAYPVYQGPPLPRERFGVQIHLHREDLAQIMAHLQALDVGWVKVQVSWKLFEPEPGRYDDFLLQEVDQLVSRSATQGIQVLLSVAKAPEWSRPLTELDGPPADPATFQAFMRMLAGRYQGNVAAYELWNEPNLQREWHGATLDPAAFVALIRAGAAGVHEGDPAALVISGAPATTGINDGVTAMDDRVYLQGMLTAGVGEVVDGIGVHPYGWANPPEALAGDGNPQAPTHNNHPSFFFRHTLADYRALLEMAGHNDLPLWVTEFGWGSFERFGVPPPAGAEFMNDVSEWQQADYTLRALAMAAGDPHIGPMILWNLNFAPLLGLDFSEAGYSLLGLAGEERPVYWALQTIPHP